MMRGMGNMQGMMKQVQKMQKEMVAAQELLNEKEFIGEATNGYVKIVATGDRKIKEVTMDPAIIDPEDAEMLQDLILTCVNEALRKVDSAQAASMGKYNIPGMM